MPAVLNRATSDTLLPLHRQLCQDAIQINPATRAHMGSNRSTLYFPLLPACPSVPLSGESHIYMSFIFQKSVVGITVCFNMKTLSSFLFYSHNSLCHSGSKKQLSKGTNSSQVPKSF